MPDDIVPIAVVDGQLGILLGQVLLDLVHAGSLGAVVGNVLQLLVDDGVQLLVAAGVCIVGDGQRGIGFVVLVQIEVDADAIGAALLLAYRVGVGNGEAALQEVKLQVALGCERHVGGIVDADIGQRCGLLLAEHMGRLAAHDTGNVIPVGLLLLIGRGQGGQILTQQRAQLVQRHMADDDGLEVGSIAETLLVNLEDTVVVSLVDHLLCNRSQTGMVTIEDGTYRVVVVHLG